MSGMTNNVLFSGSIGEYCHSLAEKLFPICRSITGPGVRETLSILAEELPGLEVCSVPSGTQVFDWTIPDEWSIRDAYIADASGSRVVDFKENNLHVLGYSEPVNESLSLEELDPHLYTQPDQPDAIPYVTSYYKKRWGFCLSQNQKDKLSDGVYKVVIDSELKAGVLNYGELVIPGKSDKEVFISTYICHPSMANNELSGPVVTTAIAKWLSELSENKSLSYTYRIVFIPETIGSITYLSRNIHHLKQSVIAGFNVTCIGDDRCYSFLPSRRGETISDRAALHVLHHIDKDFKKYTWLDRGSDERQYCAPGVDLPMATIMRSKYGEYPEYHTSLDDLSFVTPTGLEGGFGALKEAIEVVEKNVVPVIKVYCEPQLGKRGLYPTISQKGSGSEVRDMMNIISYCDGGNTVLDIAERLDIPFKEVYEIVSRMKDHDLAYFE
ncbi:DUF4910 domain-containing protein [Halomonas saccharevitans]|uniref:Aminopeptidase-like domain-containing protein n=1 Tax=Halomonas saccharevitans TaxID=416872 RepID=A0A1I7CIS0_9GAMM|nr:DUF4910 domain-containing protein [Halomonas saccharevitans]SFT99302.1 aminopeptidase-like domain-containing protein [Halomonas saccharevitans]